MSTTVSMWLGIAFVLLAVFASVLQAWLWSFPMAPDPGGPDPNGKSTAPPFWTAMHRIMGLCFVVIYVVLMWEMVPRLWEYQFELPARTIVHACMGIVIGVLLVTKIAIIRWLQHFGKALPSIGLGILTCTIILATLSIPFALRAHDFGSILQPEARQRVERLLSTVDFEEQNVDVASLATEDTYREGVRVLTTKCTACHDVRTILYKPRTARSWYSLVKRMAVKPTLGDRLHEHEIPAVTAYLVAITPELQESFQQRAQKERKQKVAAQEVRESTAQPAETSAAPSAEEGQKLLEAHCTDCHELDEIESHGPDDAEGWRAVITDMVEEQGAELSDEEARAILAHLVATRGK